MSVRGQYKRENDVLKICKSELFTMSMYCFHIQNNIYTYI